MIKQATKLKRGQAVVIDFAECPELHTKIARVGSVYATRAGNKRARVVLEGLTYDFAFSELSLVAS